MYRLIRNDHRDRKERDACPDHHDRWDTTHARTVGAETVLHTERRPRDTKRKRAGDDIERVARRRRGDEQHADNQASGCEHDNAAALEPTRDEPIHNRPIGRDDAQMRIGTLGS
jgi:hypothetical protein